MKQILKRVYAAENFRILKASLRAYGVRALKPIIGAKINQIFEQEQPKTLPVILHIETTSRCNIRCPSCVHAEKGGVGEDMTLENFKKFIDQFDYVAKLILYGIGEPIMHRDTFEMVKYAKSKGIYCGFFTNGTLLTERMREQIVECGQDYLNISIDGATKETFEKLRAGANYEKVIANVKALTKLVHERKSKLDIAVYTCLTHENLEELPEIVKLTSELGIPKLVVQDIMFWNRETIEAQYKGKTVDLPEVRKSEVYQEATLVAKKLGVILEAQISAGDGKRRCRLPWFFSYVTAKGVATPCNWHGWDGEKVNFGNVLEKPFQEIWNSPAYGDFRKEMKEEKITDFCDKCPMYDREMIRLA